MEAAQSLRSNSDSKVPIITRRQKEMLELIAEGMTNNEIAEKTFYQRSHCRHAPEKLVSEV
jgi:DNA-binding CsgD family transcriptional regulator